MRQGLSMKPYKIKRGVQRLQRLDMGAVNNLLGLCKARIIGPFAKAAPQHGTFLRAIGTEGRLTKTKHMHPIGVQNGGIHPI